MINVQCVRQFAKWHNAMCKVENDQCAMCETMRGMLDVTVTVSSSSSLSPLSLLSKTSTIFRPNSMIHFPFSLNKCHNKSKQTNTTNKNNAVSMSNPVGIRKFPFSLNPYHPTKSKQNRHHKQIMHFQCHCLPFYHFLA